MSPDNRPNTHIVIPEGTVDVHAVTADGNRIAYVPPGLHEALSTHLNAIQALVQAAQITSDPNSPEEAKQWAQTAAQMALAALPLTNELRQQAGHLTPEEVAQIQAQQQASRRAEEINRQRQVSGCLPAFVMGLVVMVRKAFFLERLKNHKHLID